MKTRNGFVSNSSSSSFVLKVGLPFDDVFELAEYMIPKREWDDDKKLLNTLKNLKTKKSNRTSLSSNKLNFTSLSFRSCNYDTYIAKLGDYFLIETCHNHDWELDDFRVACPPEFEEHFGDDSFYELPHKFNFYNLDKEFYGRPLSYKELDDKKLEYCCGKCSSDYWQVDGSHKIRCNCKE
jgi:hypothetical protein